MNQTLPKVLKLQIQVLYLSISILSKNYKNRTFL